MNERPAALGADGSGFRAGSPTPPFDWRGTALRACYGPDALDQVAAAADGLTRLMLLSGRRAGQGAACQRLRAALGERVAVHFSDVPAHSAEDVVSRGADLARSAAVDGLVAVGGGSVSDTAKAIAIVLAEGGRIADHANVFFPPDRCGSTCGSAQPG